MSRTCATSVSSEALIGRRLVDDSSSSSIDLSAFTMICSALTAGVSLLPTDGSCISPGAISGAVIMKITSSTSITSMYGTTLIWLIGLRARRMARRSSLSLKNVRELLDERLEPHCQPVYVVREAVVRDHRRYGGEEADGRRDQRLRDTGSNVRKRRLADIGEAAKRIHDPPHRAEQPNVGRHRAHGREPGEVRLDRVDLPLVGSAHRAARRVERHHRRAALPAMLGEFAKAGGEDVLQSAAHARLPRLAIQRLEVAALPELVLERVGFARHAPQLEHLEEDLPPRQQRERSEQQHDRLHDHRGVKDRKS